MITPAFGPTATERVLPKLALDFTTASLDARVTFTRTTGASNPATYVDSNGYIASATNNQPRFDYDPVTKICKGLLIEESRVNSCLQSQAFNVTWGLPNLTYASQAVVNPAGSANSDTLVESTGTGFRHANQNLALTAATYTASIYAKTAGTQYLWIQFSGSSGANSAVFDLVNGTASGTGFSITAVGNGWYRCTCTITLTTGTINIRYGLSNTNAIVSYTGNGTSGINVYGAQVELGAFPTSYIPTTTTALTRNADVAVMTGTNFSDWWQATRGGVLVRARPGTVSGVRTWLQFDDGTNNEIIALRGNTTNPELYIVDGGTPQAQIDAGTISANTDYSLTGWWATNDCKARLDSGAVVTDTSATIPTVTQARLGSDGTNYLNGHLSSISYYDSFSEQIYTRRKNKAVFSLL